MISQKFLIKSGEYNVVAISELGSQLLRGELTPRLLRARPRSQSSSAAKSTASWEGVDRELFEVLRERRTAEAAERNVPAYVVFSDASLRDMARRRPSTIEGFRLCNGVGQQKQDDYGEAFLELIKNHCETANLEQDVKFVAAPTPVAPKALTASSAASFQHFEAGLSVEEVAKELGRATSTTRGYLTDYIQHNKITEPSRWVDSDTIEKVTKVIEQIGAGPLRPYYLALDEKVSYDDIRVVVECQKNA